MFEADGGGSGTNDLGMTNQRKRRAQRKPNSKPPRERVYISSLVHSLNEIPSRKRQSVDLSQAVRTRNITYHKADYKKTTRESKESRQGWVGLYRATAASAGCWGVIALTHPSEQPNILWTNTTQGIKKKDSLSSNRTNREAQTKKTTVRKHKTRKATIRKHRMGANTTIKVS